ncbi:MAG: protoporphyrinogen oxidase [Chloroflexota bacterium]|nr:MAG: protoporphyrinogen oxidase [Chloroflexota bacterium]
MNQKVIVTYASKYGATAEIAEKIGAVLCQAGLSADVMPMDAVRDLNAYQAVVLGSGIYIGQWNKKAAAFLKAHEKCLEERQVWLFSSGPTGEGDPVALVKGQRIPAALQPVAERIHPRDIAVFHGYINPGKVNFLVKWVIKNIVKAPFGDYRDWDSIVRWATGIASTLQNAEPA